MLILKYHVALFYVMRFENLLQ